MALCGRRRRPNLDAGCVQTRENAYDTSRCCRNPGLQSLNTSKKRCRLQHWVALRDGTAWRLACEADAATTTSRVSSELTTTFAIKRSATEASLESHAHGRTVLLTHVRESLEPGLLQPAHPVRSGLQIRV